MSENLYVIEITQPGQKKCYFATDDNSGGYPWFPDALRYADKMVLEEARKRLAQLQKSAEKGTYLEYSDGCFYPSAEIASALGLNSNNKLRATATFAIKKIVLADTDEQIVVTAEIHKPEKQNVRVRK